MRSKTSTSPQGLGGEEIRQKKAAHKKDERQNGVWRRRGGHARVCEKEEAAANVGACMRTGPGSDIHEVALQEGTRALAAA